MGVVVLLLGLSVAGGSVLAAAQGSGPFGVTAPGGEFGSNDDVGSNGDVGSNDEFEPNDDFDTAAEVSLPFEREALRTHVEDFDYFAVDLQRGDRLDVSVLFDHDRGDIDLAIYDPNRDVVASSLSSTDGESASIQAGMAGTYYVLVRGWAESETSYTISVTREDGTLPANDEFEYNDGFSSATLIETPFDRAELRLAPGDVDVYAVELEADRVLNVTARFVHNRSDIDVELYDSDEELIAAGLSATDNESLSAVTESTDVYYIRVSSAADGAAYYSLSVSDSRAGTPSPTATATPTRTATATATPTTRTATPTSPTVTPSQTPTGTPTVTGSQTASDTAADPTTGTPPDVVTPGFGIGVAALAVAAAAVLLTRRRVGG